MPGTSRTTATTAPRRVRVVGNSGAGKSTVARELARRLGVPHLELDAVFWDAGWVHRDTADAHRRLADFLAGPGATGWVTCGNWNTKLDGMLDDADTILWLDYPRRVIMTRVVRRTLARGITRRELWHGNRESLANLLRLDPEKNIVRWSWTQHGAYRRTYEDLAATDPRVVRLTSPRRTRAWLDAVAPGINGRA